MLSIAYKNMKTDRLRVGVLILGVTFAVVLVTVEMGMMLGLVQNASSLIDRSRADLWVSKVDVKTFDFATPFERRVRWRIESMPGVEKVEEFNVSYTMWRLPSGGNISVQVVGYDLEGVLAPELNLVAGSAEALHNRDTIVVDETERAKLGDPKLGDTVEIMNHRAKLVGFTRGMQNFTTTPFVFTSLKRSHAYGWVTEGGKSVIYYLVKVKAGYDIAAVQSALQAAVPGVEVHTRESFSNRTRMYWLFETGAGVGFLAAAFLGLLVGGALVSQMLYTMTIDKLGEYGLLKALGSSMGELAQVVLGQSLLCGLGGLIIGLGISYILAAVATAAGTKVLIPASLALIVAALTVLLCSCAALFSIRCLKRLEPAMVFRV